MACAKHDYMIAIVSTIAFLTCCRPSRLKNKRPKSATHSDDENKNERQSSTRRSPDMLGRQHHKASPGHQLHHNIGAVYERDGGRPEQQVQFAVQEAALIVTIKKA